MYLIFRKGRKRCRLIIFFTSSICVKQGDKSGCFLFCPYHHVCYPRIINPLLIALSHDEIGPLSEGGSFFAEEKGSGRLPK